MCYLFRFMPSSLLHNRLTTAACERLLIIRGKINKTRHEQQNKVVLVLSLWCSRSNESRCLSGDIFFSNPPWCGRKAMIATFCSNACVIFSHVYSYNTPCIRFWGQTGCNFYITYQPADNEPLIWDRTVSGNRQEIGILQSLFVCSAYTKDWPTSSCGRFQSNDGNPILGFLLC